MTKHCGKFVPLIRMLPDADHSESSTLVSYLGIGNVIDNLKIEDRRSTIREKGSSLREQ